MTIGQPAYMLRAANALEQLIGTSNTSVGENTYLRRMVDVFQELNEETYEGSLLHQLWQAITNHTPNNLAVNPNFFEDEGWFKGAGWSIDRGAHATSGSASFLYQLGMPLVSGHIYHTKFTVTGRTAGGVSLLIGTTSVSSDATDNGTFTKDIAASWPDVPSIGFFKDADFDGTVSLVSVVAS